MNLQKNKNKNQKINQKKIWISFLGFFIASFSLSAMLPLSCGQSVEAQTKAAGIPIKSDGGSDTTTDDGIASPEPDGQSVETQAEAAGITIKNDGGSDTTTDDGIASPEPEEVISKITSDVNLFTSDIQSQTLTNPSYFVANGKTSVESLKKMNINIPALSQEIRREYEIKELILAEKASLKVEITIFHDGIVEKESITLNINWDLTTDQKTKLENMNNNITVTKKDGAEKLDYKYGPEVAKHLNITNSDSSISITHQLLKASPLNEDGKSEIKMKLTNSDINLEKTFEITALESKTLEENNELLLPMHEFLATEGRISIPDNKYQGLKIPYGFKIPNNITTIGKSAFKDATLPLDFSLADTKVIKIDQRAFQRTTFLSNFALNDSEVTTIEDEAFAGSILPKGFTLFDSKVTKFGNYIFSNATLPPNFQLPISITRIKYRMFEKTTFSTALILSNILIIEEEAFKDVHFPPNFTLENTEIKTIDIWAFVSTILPPGFSLAGSKIISIGRYAFFDNILPLNFKIPDNPGLSIDENAFRNTTLPAGAKWFDKTNTQNNVIAAGSYVALEPRS